MIFDHFCNGRMAMIQIKTIIIKNPLIDPNTKPRDRFIHWLLFERSAICTIFVKILVAIKVTENNREKERNMPIHSSICNRSFTFTENFVLLDIEIRIAKMSPSNLPNSSMSPRLNPITPSNTINNKARPSKNQDIYPNNSLKITLAVFPSMDPAPR